MVQDFSNKRRGGARARVALIVATLAASLTSVVGPVAHAEEGVDKRSEYATSIVARHNKQVVTEDTKPIALSPGTSFELTFHWAVGDKAKPKAGDYMHFKLPAWMVPTVTNNNLAAGDYTICSFEAGKPDVRCTFTDFVESANSKNMDGYFGIEMKALATDNPEPVRWNDTATNIYQVLTKQPTGRIVAAGVKGTDASNSPLAKGANWSADVTHGGAKYQQILWSVVVPPSKLKAAPEGVLENNRLVISDELQSLEITHPDTGAKVSLPQFFSPKFNVTLSRRDGAAVTDGVWDISGSGGCTAKAGGDPADKSYYQGTDIRCAESVATVSVADGSVNVQNVKTETVTATMPRAGQFTRNNEVSIVIDNPVPDAAYRLTMYTWLPMDLLPPNRDGFEQYTLRNTAHVGTEAVAAPNGFHAYTRAWGGSKGDPDFTTVKIAKAVKENVAGQLRDSAEFTETAFPVVVKVDGQVSQDCTAVSSLKPCEVKISKGQSLEITEPKPTVGGFAWKDGVFSVKDDPSRKTQVEVAGNTVRIPAGAGVLGEQFTAVLTNEFSKTGGSFAVRKSVVIDDQAAAANKEFSFEYACEHGGEVVGHGTITGVREGVAQKVDKTFPIGAVCEIAEKRDDAAITGYTLGQTPTQRVTIGNAGEVATAEFTNTYSRDMGKFQVQKVLTGDAVSRNDFTVEYTCTDNPALKRTLTFAKGDTTPQDSVALPTGTKCTVTEKDAQVPGFTWTHSIKKGEELSNEVVIAADSTPVVTVTNNYATQYGGFQIAKTVVNQGADIPATYDFTAVCKDNAGVEILNKDYTVTPGTPTEQVKVPVGSTCTISEKNDPSVDPVKVGWTKSFTLAKDDAQPEAVAGEDATFTVENENTVYLVHATNTFVRHTGTVTVAKTVSGPQTVALAARDYTFNLTCTDGQKATVTAKGDGVAVPAGIDVPVGESCTVTEDAVTAQANNFDLVVPAAQTAVVERKDQVVPLRFDNAYTQHTGTFSVAKKVDGPQLPVLVDKEYIFNATCTDGQNTTVKVKGTGEAVSADVRLPIGTECTITEDAAAAQQAHFDVVVAQPQKVTIAKKDEVVPSTFTNTYSQHMGTFSVAKQVNGLMDVMAAKHEFAFNITCTDGQKATVIAKGDAKPVASGVIVPVGTECTIAEDAAAAQVTAFDVTLAPEQKVVVEAKDENKTLTFVNEYAIMPWVPAVAIAVPLVAAGVGVLASMPVNPAPVAVSPQGPAPVAVSPQGPAAAPEQAQVLAKTPEQKGMAKQAAPAAKKPALANTGASVLGIVLLALALMAAGVFFMRRKQS
ncbi:MAG: DUF5979 domain-containing protein [Corynebacterium sp.]|uniref:DUF5979 domain-containing protein n=1 Tax=Corynebacterium sp. TaxID=1720 RepID=UPI0026DB4DC8|nr:DUF5979 domain-containing protein [Corynebacterium sp.]MDO4761663.1 DUF5979 domain-containing protein [Corynebacterium sp.]